jgi:hypothetical protein
MVRGNIKQYKEVKESRFGGDGEGEYFSVIRYRHIGFTDITH